MSEPGEPIAEGKTKKVLAIVGDPNNVIISSKDRITAGDGARAHDLSGKAKISNATTCKIFSLLKKVGFSTHFVSTRDNVSFVARRCYMVPIEWVTRRIATGSFLVRNSGVEEGHRFTPPKQETFFKDDKNNDPMYSEEQLLFAKFQVNERLIGQYEIDVMKEIACCVFEVLEKIWASLDCVLVDMKIEFGIDAETSDILIADVIDSDSWRLWPSGDSRLMKDKQVYRNLTTVTAEDLEVVKKNFQWVVDKLDTLQTQPRAQIIILMGSPSDGAYSTVIQNYCVKEFRIPTIIRTTSAHKAPDQTLKILAEYEACDIPTVIIAVAGRSNGLGPLCSGNCSLPVINCPPINTQSAMNDIWSSLHLPSGLGCVTVISQEAAALCAAQIFALHDSIIWSRLRVKRCQNWLDLKAAD
jgi:phosphoribosylaminoimidazole carboxylase/phosphoribosylaminoimidazole-succinocarboxamide synthase